MIRKLLLLILICLSTCFNSFSVEKNVKAIRGVWVPAPRYTDVLHTYENVEQFVNTLDLLNFNAIFLSYPRYILFTSIPQRY